MFTVLKHGHSSQLCNNYFIVMVTAMLGFHGDHDHVAMVMVITRCIVVVAMVTLGAISPWLQQLPVTMVAMVIFIKFNCYHHGYNI